MIESILLATHIPSHGPLEPGCTIGVTFQERLQMGLYDARKGLADRDGVITPLGSATGSQVKRCNILNRMCVVVYLNTPRVNGARLAAFDVWQVKTRSSVGQTSLW